MAKQPQPISDDRQDNFYEELGDILNDLPADLGESADDDAESDTDVDADEPVDDTDTDDESDEDTDEEDTDDGGDEEEDDDDYITTADEEEETPAPVVTPPNAPAAVASDIGQYILANLSKIPVNILVAGADGKDVVQRLEVYGYGDLPTNFKGYANPLEGERFRGAVTAQEIKAQNLKDTYDRQKLQETTAKQTEEYTRKENRAIADDLKDLRTEGLFPKFKGNPNTKEFNESDGAKEFDRVVKFMNERNDLYMQRANAGKNYRHIGFREAYEMLNGQNPKAAEQAEDKQRKKIAGKVVSRRGARAETIKTGVARVSNLNDLADEFTSRASS